MIASANFREFFKYYENAFTAKETHVIATAICLLKNPDAYVWQEAEQEKCVL